MSLPDPDVELGRVARDGRPEATRVSMPAEPVSMAAGLYHANVDPKTGEKVDVYTTCTVPPNEFWAPSTTGRQSSCSLPVRRLTRRWTHGALAGGRA